MNKKEIVEVIEPYQRPKFKVKQKLNGWKVIRVRAETIDGKDMFVYTLEDTKNENKTF